MNSLIVTFKFRSFLCRYFVLSLLCFTPNLVSAQIIEFTVYVDSESGHDENDGRSQRSAWRSLEKINNSTFGPGARILLKAGGIWIGYLQPKGSGSAKQPITIDKYGTGEKPLLDGTAW